MIWLKFLIWKTFKLCLVLYEGKLKRQETDLNSTPEADREIPVQMQNDEIEGNSL